MKKIIPLLTVLVILTAFPLTVNANGVTEEYVTFPVFANLEQFETYADSASGFNTIVGGIIRSSATDQCQVYLYWSGQNMLNSIKYKSIEVQSTSLFNPITYHTQGDGINYSYAIFGTAYAGSVHIFDLSIPTNQAHVYVKVTDAQAYYVDNGWVSISLSGSDVIN